ncbi:MAG: hypothetical protein HYX59_09930 [Elusimicrobia bacterium]|nr:hypothetical protein [Elusimicrobiota bacterium]
MKPKSKPDSRGRVLNAAGENIDGLMAGFEHDGRFYPIKGWVAYSKKPYKDELMAGVRIYCRGKIAAQTHIFNLRAGFTGEYDIRSYLVGEINADWLDESEDLIRTDRQDILWSHPLGRAFEGWGQSVVKYIGKISREPTRQRAWKTFEQVSDIAKKIEKAFPSANQASIRESTLVIAKSIASRAREEELNDEAQADRIVQLALLLGPHITLDAKLREAAEKEDSSLAMITGILRTARVAELCAFGKIADDRVNVIKTVEKLKDDEKTLEEAFQKLIESAPWLIEPGWAPITANQSFMTLRKEFQKFYKAKTGQELVLGDFSDDSKRADFVMSNQGGIVQIIEIKRPGHALENKELDRINKYIELMREFLQAKGQEPFRKLFQDVHVTLVCDKLALTGIHDTAFKSLSKLDGDLTHMNWTTFLLRTRQTHQSFLDEAERQRSIEVKD